MMSATPVSRDKKRDASSPLDADSMKKSRMGSSETECETEPCTIHLSDDHISKIAEVLKENFAGQLKEMATHIVSEVMAGLKQTVSDLKCENEQLREKIKVLEKK